MSKLFEYNDRWASLVVLIGAIAIFALVARDLSPYTPDDAYISYRYAENLAEGRRITFNPGENNRERLYFNPGIPALHGIVGRAFYHPCNFRAVSNAWARWITNARRLGQPNLSRAPVFRD